jgi:hypothetical protein
MATQIPALEKFMRAPQNTGANDPKPQPVFAGFQRPSVDLDAVRDGRRAPLLYVDVPLDTVKTIANGSPVILPISGNSFYIDQDQSIVGNAFSRYKLRSIFCPYLCRRGLHCKSAIHSNFG